MPEPIVYVDNSRIRAGTLDETKAAMETLAEFVAANEPQLIAYGFFLDEEQTQMSCVAIHPDSASLEFHMDVAGPGFRAFRELIDMTSIDVYGPLEASVLDLLKEKAAMLGTGATVTLHRRHAGLTRFGD